MPGLNVALSARIQRPRHRWQGASLNLIDSPLWLQREARQAPAFISSQRPPPIDTIALALAADARNSRREAWLGAALAIGAVALLIQGWLLPAMAAAFMAAPIIGLGLAIWDREKGN